MILLFFLFQSFQHLYLCVLLILTCKLYSTNLITNLASFFLSFILQTKKKVQTSLSRQHQSLLLSICFWTKSTYFQAGKLMENVFLFSSLGFWFYFCLFLFFAFYTCLLVIFLLFFCWENFLTIFPLILDQVKRHKVETVRRLASHPQLPLC